MRRVSHPLNDTPVMIMSCDLSKRRVPHPSNEIPVMTMFSTIDHVKERELVSQAIVAPADLMVKFRVVLKIKKSVDRS